MKHYTIETLFDTSNRFIVENIIADKSISLIVASPKKGRTALGLNLALCVNAGIDFLEKKVRQTKVVYYCNELSGTVIQERVKKIEIPCLPSLKFYNGTSCVTFEEFEEMIEKNIQEGYKLFVVDTFSKIKYERNLMPMITTTLMK
ncbi:helicase RepA family protein [Campylobacter pinnipediorum]|uniref:helicase RepA family protein n=2 Tax=Campylobacter pinnipediorum TaxID=1965231 RepID=UPI00214ADC9C|nr:helicase RepA family protein [Campylobacter pinnipediorum]